MIPIFFFSAILNTKSHIGHLIINGSKYFEFYSIGLLKEEILRHKDRILQITRYTNDQFWNAYQYIIERITFIEDIFISEKAFENAIDLVSDVDLDDVAFVALNEYLQSYLWTGDKELINGLHNKGYTKTVSTKELFEIYLDKTA